VYVLEVDHVTLQINVLAPMDILTTIVVHQYVLTNAQETENVWPLKYVSAQIFMLDHTVIFHSVLQEINQIHWYALVTDHVQVQIHVLAQQDILVMIVLFLFVSVFRQITILFALVMVHVLHQIHVVVPTMCSQETTVLYQHVTESLQLIIQYVMEMVTAHL
jgi:hypothetical protein